MQLFVSNHLQCEMAMQVKIEFAIMIEERNRIEVGEGKG